MAINQDFETMEDTDCGFEKWLSGVVANAVVAPAEVLGCDENGAVHL